MRAIAIAVVALLAAGGGRSFAAPAVPAGAMPAMLEFTTTFHSPIMTGTLTAKVSVIIPQAGNFRGEAGMTHRYTLIGPLASCSHNLNRTDTLAVRGVRTGDNLAIDVTVTPRSFRRPTITCPRGGYGYGPPLPTVSDSRYHLTYADNAERSVPRTFGDVRINGRVRLKLACATRTTPASVVKTILPRASGTWPLQVKTNVSKTRIGSLRITPDTDIYYGLTRPVQPMLPTHSVAGHHAPSALRGGICYWVDGVTVEFPAIEMYIASDYPQGSCNYSAIFDHEYRHYQDLARMLREGQQRVRQELESASFPSQSRPRFFFSRQEADAHIKSRMDALLQPTIRYILDSARTLSDEWHADDYRVTLARCPDW